jgi:hypothetical protein
VVLHLDNFEINHIFVDMTHNEILERIQEIEVFFEHLGLLKKNGFTENWNLDSNIKYAPKDFSFLVNYNNQERILIHIDINIISGLIFTFSGTYKPELHVYEQIHTDYYFKHKYRDFKFFTQELRDFELKKLLENEIS